MYEAIRHHAEEVSVWLEPSREDADSRINDVNVAEADVAKISVERNLIPVSFKEHVRALQTLVNANVKGS